MKALILNCTLKPSPIASNTEALATEMIDELQRLGADVKMIRVVDHDVHTGPKSDMGNGDAWPAILDEILASDILVMASPTWMAGMSSIAMRVLERFNGTYNMQDENGFPVMFNKVAGFIVTGDEDGARHVVVKLAGALMDVGFTIAPQSYTYWNNGPGPGTSYLKTDFRKDWSVKTAKSAAANLIAVVKALKATPINKANNDL